MVPLPAPVASSSGPQRTEKHTKRKYNPVKSTKDSGEGENGWDTILVQFQVKLHGIVHNGQPSGGLSPETELADNIVKTVKEDLKRSVSRIFYCVLVHRFTDSAISATATPGRQGRRGRTPPACGRLPHGAAGGNHPREAEAGFQPGPRQIEKG